MNATAQPVLTPDELIKLCAVDNNLFAKTFFPKAARQEPAPFHADIWSHLENPRLRYVNLVCFRDSAKTTLLRMFTGKRVAYNVSRTILYIGASEAHAVRSIRWIKARIEEKMGAGGLMRKEPLATTFGLTQGAKWTDTEIEIVHKLDNSAPIWLLGMGITGNTRGVNFDDYRPDLIICDDILTDENGASKEQREKVIEILMGSIKGSLAPASEMPNAKLVMLNTPQALDDVVHEAEKDPEFFTARYSCWTPQTENLDLDKQESSWPARYPSPTRRAEKAAAIKLNRLSTFAKEKEVRIISKELAVFNRTWLQFWEKPEDIPPGGVTVLFIDPTPPPDEKKDKTAKQKLDFEVIGALKRVKGNFYLLGYDALQGGKPDWTINKFFEYRWTYRPLKAVIETVNYQRTLKWLLEEEMRKRQQWLTILPFAEIRSKYNRIVSAVHKTASDGKLFVHPSMSALIDQYENYPSVRFDDHLDGLSIGIHTLNSAAMQFLDNESTGEGGADLPKIKMRRGCP